MDSTVHSSTLPHDQLPPSNEPISIWETDQFSSRSTIPLWREDLNVLETIRFQFKRPKTPKRKRKRGRGDDLSSNLNKNQYLAGPTRQYRVLRSMVPKEPQPAPTSSESGEKTQEANDGEATEQLDAPEPKHFPAPRAITSDGSTVSGNSSQARNDGLSSIPDDRRAHTDPVTCSNSDPVTSSTADPVTSSNPDVVTSSSSEPIEDLSGFMPSEENDFQFEYGNPKTGRSAKQLNRLFQLRKGPPIERFNVDISGLSYKRTGDLPSAGLVDNSIAKMEKKEAKYQEVLRKEQGFSSSEDEDSDDTDGAEKRRRKRRKFS